MTQRTALFVLGMHRSGTSALTRVLAFLGASLPLNLYPPGPGNEAGHWEPEAAVSLHDEILESAGTSVNDVFGPPDGWFETPAANAFVTRMKALLETEYGASPLFVLKDPRASLVFPLWRTALAEMDIRGVAAIVSRHPVEVAHSLARRQEAAAPGQSWPTDRGGLLWLRYMLAAERHTRGMRRSFCRYSDLLDDWRAVALRLGAELAVSWPRDVSDAERDVAGFLSEARRHHREHDEATSRGGVWSSWIAPISAELRRAADGQEPDLAVFDKVGRSFSEACNGPPALRSELPAAISAPRLRVMTGGTADGPALCLAGDRFWNGDPDGGGLAGVVDAAIAADMAVTVIDFGAFDHARLEVFEAFARSRGLEVRRVDFDGSQIAPSFLEPSIRLFRYVRDGSFDAILFQDADGLGYASAVARRTGLAFGRTLIGVVACGSRGWRRGREREFPRDLVAIGAEHSERKAAELADVVVCPDPAIAQWMRDQGWRTTPLMPSEPCGGEDVQAGGAWVAILRRLTATALPALARPREAADVSVVITHFEQPLLLDQNLEALTRQTDPDFSVVVVDDGSRSTAALDYLASVQEKFGTLRLSLVRRENRYLGAARNAGIRAAESEWVILLDDDNVAFPDLVRALRQAMISSGADVVTCGLRPFADESGPPDLNAPAGGPDQFFSAGPMLLGAIHNCFGDASAIYRKEVVESVGGFHEIAGVTFEDWQLHLRIAAAGYSILSLPEALVWYRVRQGSMLRRTSHYDNARVIASVVDGLPAARLPPLCDYLIGTELQQSRLNAEVGRLRSQSAIDRRIAQSLFAAQRAAFSEIAGGRSARNLQAALRERTANAADAERYARSLEAALADAQAANETATRYARSLEQSRAEIEQYARRLEAELRTPRTHSPKR